MVPRVLVTVRVTTLSVHLRLPGLDLSIRHCVAPSRFSFRTTCRVGSLLLVRRNQGLATDFIRPEGALLDVCPVRCNVSNRYPNDGSVVSNEELKD